MIDYTNEAFVIPIEADDVKGYASVHAEMYRDEDGLDLTGNYFVYLLHPIMGSTKFTIEPSFIAKGVHSTDGDTPQAEFESSWRKKGGAAWIERDVIIKIVNEIERKLNKPLTSYPNEAPTTNY